MLRIFSQIVNWLYEFIYGDATIQRSGLGLPSIVVLSYTIDKSWTLLIHRNSEEFLDVFLHSSSNPLIKNSRNLEGSLDEDVLWNDKTKDTVKARQDLETLKVRKELWLVKKPNGKLEKPHPKYSFTTEGRKCFCKFIKGVRLPDGFGSNFKQKVTADDNNITGMKSHDCHIMMHRLLPYGVQRYLPKNIAAPIIEFFVIHFKQIVLELCAAGMSEAKKTTWMFPFERYMKKLKNYVRNKAKPEGSIAEGYVAEEALTFCSRYLKDDVETRFNRLGRNERRQAVVWLYLTNSPKVSQDILAYREKSPDNVETNFPAWFNHKSPIMRLYMVAAFKCYTAVEFDYFEHTDLSINSESTEVDALPVNDDNANANEGNAEDDVYAHVLDDDDDVVVSDDDEVNPSTNMACVFPRSHGGDAGGSPTRRPSAKIWYRPRRQGIICAKKVWGDRTEDEWNNLVDWWSHPDRVARSLQNAANRAKNTILTHQGKKSFAQGRNEYKVQKGHYEDLIETWRKTHSRPETGEFKTQKNLKRYLDMKSMQDQVRAGVIPYKTDQDILDEVVPSTNRQNMSGKGRKLPGGGSTSRRRGPQAFPDVISREEMDRILRQRDQEAELLRKQTAEAQQRAYLAALKADAAYQNSETMYGAIDRELAGEDNDVGDNNEEGDNQQSGGDYSEDEEGDNEEVQNESEESD
ncbi:hypothetical protein Tco_0514155 [Tanacetum coccineum]